MPLCTIDLLSSSLEKFSDARTLIGDGGLSIDAGLWDTSGVCHGNYWVEGICATGELFVADISADQHGFEKILVLPNSNSRTRNQPGDAARVAKHLLDELSACAHEASEISVMINHECRTLT